MTNYSLKLNMLINLVSVWFGFNQINKGVSKQSTVEKHKLNSGFYLNVHLVQVRPKKQPYAQPLQFSPFVGSKLS